jgi:hypothetical protein
MANVDATAQGQSEDERIVREANAMDTQLIEKMHEVYVRTAKDYDSGAFFVGTDDYRVSCRKKCLEAAAKVQQKHILDVIGGPVTDVEWYGCEVRRCPTRETINILLASRVSKYTAPQERVTTRLVKIGVKPDFWEVFLDGKSQPVHFLEEEDAEIYADGLRYRIEREKAGKQ